MLERFTSETFSGLLGDRFRVTAADGRLVDLVLASCEPHPAGPPSVGSGRAPFSLLFHAADGALIPQQTCSVSHPELGDFDLFVVPLGPDERGMRYEAVFT